jgi:hypothetical protein
MLLENLSPQELDKLVLESNEEQLEEMFKGPNKNYIRKLSQKSKEKLSKLADKKIDSSIDNIIQIMKNNQYENLTDRDL